MLKIILDVADNGIIKTIEDNNINGAGNHFEKKIVYDFSNDDKYKNRINFFHNISDELGIELGNNFDKNVLHFKVDWGTNYEPNKNEVLNKIKELELNIEALKLYLKEEFTEEDESN
jgi:hypothetical protein